MEPLRQARADLACYGAALWPPFEVAAHHRLIIEHLERIERGEIDRLMIFMPPRHGKSLITSTLFPSWFLGRRPDRSIIASSYGAELANDFGRRCRGFVTDDLHHRIFPDCRVVDDSNAVHRFGLTAGGNYYAVGANGPVTGRGADLLLIDDPIKSREDANSATFRRNLQSWYENVAYTRLQPGGAIVLIQTRWHEDDLAGWLLREHAAENWTLVSLPALAEAADALDRDEGDALWPEKFPLATLERIREAIGGSAWASLYQQRPAPEAGAIFRRDWFKTIPAGENSYSRIICSLDTAFKARAANDYSVIEVWGETKTGYHLLHCVRERLEFPALTSRAVALAAFWKPHAVLIEDAASGQSLIQSLKAETRLPILPVRPQGDKVSRAHAVSPLVESGRVFLPESATWRDELLDEVTSFPAAAHDDQVDSMTQALAWLRGQGNLEYNFIACPQSAPTTGRVSAATGWRDRHSDELDDARADARRGSVIMRARRSRWAGY
ncbi:MAG TPA: phage terminase large subunit [Candidatus Binataceae bacterium]|nr:phage terminase large subunit [Candidatus Binataceae bacterium]